MSSSVFLGCTPYSCDYRVLNPTDMNDVLAHGVRRVLEELRKRGGLEGEISMQRMEYDDHTSVQIYRNGFERLAVVTVKFGRQIDIRMYLPVNEVLKFVHVLGSIDINGIMRATISLYDETYPLIEMALPESARYSRRIFAQDPLYCALARLFIDISTEPPQRDAMMDDVFKEGSSGKRERTPECLPLDGDLARRARHF